MCKECYVEENRITPLLNPLECLKNHTQYREPLKISLTGFSSQFLEVYLRILLRRIFVSYCNTITYENTRRVSLKTNKGF